MFIVFLDWIMLEFEMLDSTLIFLGSLHLIEILVPDLHLKFSPWLIKLIRVFFDKLNPLTCAYSLCLFNWSKVSWSLDKTSPLYWSCIGSFKTNKSRLPHSSPHNSDKTLQTNWRPDYYSSTTKVLLKHFLFMIRITRHEP